MATALVAWLSARQVSGRFVLRVEDLDRPRVVAGVEGRQLDDLRWLGLDWDEGPDVGGPHPPYRQSERSAHYDAALERLAAAGLLYYCDCSRAEIARVASAPHAGDDGPRYPGTCRDLGLTPRAWKRPPAVRLRIPERSLVTVDDALQGTIVQDVGASVGDFVLRRGDGVHAYQLACVVDDLAMGVTEVVRGADLVDSAPRQALLARLLGGEPPRFAHVPLVVAADGTRLAKRAGGVTVSSFRQDDAPPRRLLAVLAELLDLDGATPTAMLTTFDRRRLAGKTTIALPTAPF
jgi:glutamyl-tRNA synthetase